MSSRNPSVKYPNNEIEIEVNEINASSLTHVQRKNKHLLKSNDNKCINDIKTICEEQMDSTMRNIKLTMELEDITVVIWAGKCENKVKVWMDSDNVHWKYTKKTKRQAFRDFGRGIGSLITRMLGSASKLGKSAVKAIAW